MQLAVGYIYYERQMARSSCVLVVTNICVCTYSHRVCVETAQLVKAASATFSAVVFFVSQHEKEHLMFVPWLQKAYVHYALCVMFK